MHFITTFGRREANFKATTVDGAVAKWLGVIIEMSLEMIAQLGVVVTISPVFLFPGIILAALGGWVGQLYMRAQLSIKRERSNAKAPVLGHFGAAFAGLSAFLIVVLRHDFWLIEIHSFHPRIWGPGNVQEAIVRPH